jgi:predicted transcriptional regulator of viral defense system
MQFFDLKAQLKGFLVFSIKDIEKINPNFHKQRLSEWQKKGYIKKIHQGFYIFSDLPINEQVLFLIANNIYSPSYISLEMAFSLYNLIPEGVYEITSVTSQKTGRFKTETGNFTYKHIKPELMFGYELKEYNGHRYLVAEIEKALLDYLYLNPKIKTEPDFQGLRFNVTEFKIKADMDKLKKYLEAFNSQALVYRVNKFITYLKNA